jgi:mono/diheme cytochrome c family protein
MQNKLMYALFFISSISLFTFSSFTYSIHSLSQEKWVAPAWADTLKSPFPDEPLIAAQGEELYSMHCWSCHGEEGYGDGAAGGALGVKPANFHDEQVKKQSDGALYWKLSNGRGNMPPFKDVFSDEQRWQLVAYLRKLSVQK